MREWIYRKGISIWNDNIYDKLEFLMKSQYWSVEEIRDHQMRMLREILDIAYNGSEYYRHKFDDAGFQPRHLKSLEDIKKVPAISKEELLVNKDAIQIRKEGEKLYFAETSGSTGKPLVFYRDKDWDAWMRASLFRGYAWHDVRPWERNGYLWGYNFSLKKRWKVKMLDELQNRFRLFSYNEEEIDRFLVKLESASYLSGYSSMIYELAKAINRRGGGRYGSVKMIKGTSEKIFDVYQQEVRQAFGKKMISEYGAAETGIIAFECPEGKMHANMETVIVEEESNEILVTNLMSRSFPVIRYKLGDYVELDPAMKCGCGRNQLIVKDVLGRTGKVIHGFSGRYPSLTLYYVFKNLAIEKKIILNYVAVQKEKGLLELNVESRLDENGRRHLLKEYEKYFRGDLKLKLADGVQFPHGKSKKTDFISYIDE